ncbi:E3 ubiquitin-protein ligase HECTD [Acrasis kona]|uniref:E3 ubiquitin-protein ligase HECTD n=1 Tax=Acrasis kona TaxID=1008807 RepID=A0AAW2Z742_9EUKA
MIERDDEQKLKHESLFMNGFSMNDHFSDVCINHEASGRVFNCHRLILAYNSDFFRMALSSNFLESRGQIYVKFKDPHNVFPKVLDFLYTGEVNVNLVQLVALRVASDQFQIAKLSEIVMDHLGEHLNIHNAFGVLDQSITFSDSLVLQNTAEFIATNFLKYEESFFIEHCFRLPYNVFFSIFCNEKLGLNNPECDFLDKDTTTSARLPSDTGESKQHSRSRSDIKTRNMIVSRIVNKYLSTQVETVELISTAVNSLSHSNSLISEDAIKYLLFAQNNNMTTQIKACARVIASDFHNVLKTSNQSILAMSPFCFKELINSDGLFVKSEDQVYNVANDYIRHNNAISTQDKREIMSGVRYTYLSLEKLELIKEKVMCDPNWYVTKDLLLEALWTKLLRKEMLNNESQDNYIEKINVQFEQLKHIRPRTTGVFQHVSDFDENGILYWLATNYGTEKYHNPCSRGLVEVTHTAQIEWGSPYDLISHVPCSCNLVSQTNSTVNIHFKTISISPTTYTLRHTSSRDTECLRSWNLEASIDNIDWVTLSTHVQDTTLDGRSGTGSWSLTQGDQYFNYFRIVQTSANSSNNMFLSMAGLEIYGMVKKLE